MAYSNPVFASNLTAKSNAGRAAVRDDERIVRTDQDDIDAAKDAAMKCNKQFSYEQVTGLTAPAQRREEEK